jgi:hypothetical protein
LICLFKYTLHYYKKNFNNLRKINSEEHFRLLVKGETFEHDRKLIKIIGRKYYLPTTTTRSPLMVPGSDFCGSAAPISQP